MIEDAEDEFRSLTNADMRVSRVGVAGNRRTYEQPTYKLSGHKAYRQSFSHYTFDYDYDEVEIRLENERVLPFDSTEGDEVYVYHGLGDGVGGDNWEDITDEEGGMWGIVNNVEGILAVDPELLHEALLGRFDGLPRGNQRLQKLRFAISYRYGGLGGSLKRTAQTTLDASLTDSQTGTVAVTDGSRLPSDGTGGNLILKIGGEYLEVDPDPANDQLNIIERGVRGTTGAAHSSGDRVTYTPASVRKAVAARAGMQLIETSTYSEFLLPDTDDSLDKPAKHDALEATWSATVEAMS